MISNPFKNRWFAFIFLELSIIIGYSIFNDIFSDGFDILSSLLTALFVIIHSAGALILGPLSWSIVNRTNKRYLFFVPFIPVIILSIVVGSEIDYMMWDWETESILFTFLICSSVLSLPFYVFTLD